MFDYRELCSCMVGRLLSLAPPSTEQLNNLPLASIESQTPLVPEISTKISLAEIIKGECLGKTIKVTDLAPIISEINLGEVLQTRLAATSMHLEIKTEAGM